LVQAEGKTVSVIIPLGPPRRQTLLTLKSIQKDQYPFKEIILVGNIRYKEQYKDLISSCRDANLRFVIHGNERSEQKNYGAMVASGDYIFFIDDDMIIEPGLILECIRALSENNADAVVIPQKILSVSFLGKIKKIGYEIKGAY
jgi:GT2 family glycosyltransferase